MLESAEKLRVDESVALRRLLGRGLRLYLWCGTISEPEVSVSGRYSEGESIKLEREVEGCLSGFKGG